eukprot:s1851_g2.t1
MDWKCKLVFPKGPDPNAAETALQRSPASSRSGRRRREFPGCCLSFWLCAGIRFVLCSLDVCVWPSNSAYVNNCMTSFVNVLQMSPNNAGHCQLPVMQTQTTTEAWVKHRRALEDALKKGRMDITTGVALTFDKSASHANDKRSVNHPCLFVSALDHQQANAWLGSSAVSRGVIGPCQLIRVTDMQGFDPDNRFGAAARTEQYCEFGHAVLDRLLDNAIRRPPLYYIGCLRDDQRDVAASLEERVYKHWDASELAPASRQPTEAIAEPTLELLGWTNGGPVFPDPLLQKFSEGSSAHTEILAMKKELLTEFPDAGRRSSQRSETGTPRPTGPARAAGRPDFGIDGGAQPLDTERVIEKEHIAQSAFNVTRRSWFLTKFWLKAEGVCLLVVT